MIFHKITAAIVTDGSGDATVYLGSKIRGMVLTIKYLPGTIATGADLVITGETSGIPILTEANLGTSNVFRYPRAPHNAVSDGAAGTTGTELIPIIGERIKVVVDEGGATKTGSIEVYIMTSAPF